MNIPEILTVNGLGLALMILLQISRHMTRRNRRLDDHLLSLLVFTAAAAMVLESTSFLVDGLPGLGWRVVIILSNTGLYSMTVIVSTTWMFYVDMHLYRDRKRLRRYQPLLITGTVVAAGLLVNPFFPIFFEIDAQNMYHRLPLGYLFYVYLTVCFVLTIVVAKQHRKEFRRAQFFPIPMFLVPVIVCSVIQILFYGISASWAGVAVGIVGVYINLQSRQSFVDGLTGLYNRQFLEHQMLVAREDKQSAYFGIMLDIDRFKAINDTFGHSVGDAALSNTADILLRAVGMGGQLFRYAGDEFIIILKTDREEDAVAMEENIRRECQRFNREKGRPYELAVSMGHGRYDLAVDTEDSFLRKIDREMYADKERRRKLTEEAR